MQLWFAHGSGEPPRTARDAGCFRHSERRPSSRAATAKHKRTGSAVSSSSKYPQRGLSATRAGTLGSVPPRQRGIRARGQTGCSALTCPHTRSNYCEPLSFGLRTGFSPELRLREFTPRVRAALNWRTWRSADQRYRQPADGHTYPRR